MNNILKTIVFILFFIIVSCNSNRIYERNSDIEDYLWIKDRITNFEFEITDTTLIYTVLINIRHSVHYQFTNIFIQHNLYNPAGDTISELNDILLGDIKNERWLGDALGDIIDLSAPAKNLQNIKLMKGKYKITLEQYMREDTLIGVMAVGVRVERNKTQSKK